jgi:hypothetical protein
MIKMIAFGAIAEIVFSLVLMFLDSPVKEVPGLLDLIPYFWQINEAEGGSVFLDQVHQRYPMKGQSSISKIKPFLGEIIGLLYQVEVGVFHSLRIGVANLYIYQIIVSY